MSECVFCLEGEDAERALLHNVKCRCNYCFHKGCYAYYNNKSICPMCRADVGELYCTIDSQATQVSVMPSPLPSPTPNPSAPEASPLRAIHAQAPEEFSPQPLYQVMHTEVVPAPLQLQFAMTPPSAHTGANVAQCPACIRIVIAVVCVVLAGALAALVYWFITP